MPQIDPLIRWLQAADVSAEPPALPVDLPKRVRQRRAAQLAKARRVTVGLLAVSGVFVLAIAFRFLNVTQNARRNNPELATATRTESLRAEADALKAEADALQRQANRIAQHYSRQDLRQQHESYLLTSFADQSLPSPLDRAALLGLSQGDFYRDVRKSLNEAREAYESVIVEFPDSRWAALAQSRIELLQMN